MKITSVESQKKNPKRFNIFLDGQFGFGADEDLIVDHRLIIGKEISPESLERILFDAEVGKLMARMYALFNVRPRSEKEVRDYLKNLSFKRKVKEEEEISEMAIESLIDRLKKKEMLNDRVFAKTWVESRRRSKNKGSRAMIAELYQKGIAREIVQEVIKEELEEGQSEEELASKALEKKLRTWKSLDEREFFKKGIEYLMRRGFDYSTSKEVVEKLQKKDYNNS